MAKGHLSEDTIKFIMTAETSELQQEIHKSGKAIDELKQKETNLRKEQAAVKSVLGEESKEYKELSVKIKKVTQDIADENLKLTELHKKLGTGSMTMAQLRKEAKNLQRQLDNTSQSLNPKEYEAYARKLQEVNQRMTELKATAQGITTQDNDGGGFLKRLIGSKLDLTQLKTFLAGGFIMKLGEVAMDFAGKAIDRIKDLVTESVNAARAAEGITHAFERMDQPGLLDNLRKATHGTVSDLELMKAAVQAQDFRLPLDQLGKYLEFAQLKAQQTGQSVDYLVNSIVTGLGRKSVMILDNLGLSAAEINEQMAKGGDMATAVGRIIDQQLEAQGEHFEDAAEREAKATTEVTNAQLELGKQMKETFGIGETSFSEMQAKAEAFVLKGLTKLIIYCQDLYKKLGSVRLAVELVKFTFDTAFKLCEVGFRWIIDTVKGVGRVVRDLAGMIEGVFTFDWEKIKTSWNNLGNGLVTTIVDFIKDGKDVGERWGQNALDSINATLGKGKINPPKPENELDGVTVTGTRKDKAYWQEQYEQRKKVFEATKKGSKEAAAALKELKEAERELGKYNSYTAPSKKGDDKKNRQEDQTSTDTLKRQRQQELQIERQQYEQLQRLWKEQLSKKAITQQEYDSIMLSLATEHANCVLQTEQKYAQESEALTLNDANKKKNLVMEQQNNVVTAERNAAEALLKAYQNYQKNRQQIEEQGMTEAERTERNNQLQLAALDAAYQASLEYARQTGEDTTALTESYEKAKAKMIEDQTLQAEQQRMRIRHQYGLTTMQEQYNAELETLKRHLAQKLLTEEEYRQAVENLEQEFEQRKAQVRQQYGIATKQEQYNLELEQLRQAREQELLTEEEYEQAKQQMKMQHWQEQFQYYSQLFSNAISALKDAEIASVESQYDAEIAAAKKAGKDTTALEEKKEAEKLKIQKKYADVEFAIKCAEIISNTAVAIMTAYKQLGPIAGSVAAAMLGITGAAQLAIAKAERDKVKNMTTGSSSSASSASVSGARVATGREQGGYVDVQRSQDRRLFHAKYDPRKRGYVQRPTVIVGEGPAGQSKEWVASNAAVENPTVRPVIDAIDQAQRAGNIRTLDLQKVLRQQGYQQGGYISGTNTSSSGSSSGSTAAGTSADPRLLQRLTDVLERIERDGIPALVGIDQIEAKQEQRNRARDIASK